MTVPDCSKKAGTSSDGSPAVFLKTLLPFIFTKLRTEKSISRSTARGKALYSGAKNSEPEHRDPVRRQIVREGIHPPVALLPDCLVDLRLLLAAAAELGRIAV